MKYLLKKRIILALLLLALIPLWVGIFTPIRLQIPSDFQFQADIVSVDNFYDPLTKRYSGEAFSETEYLYQMVEVKGNSAIIKSKFTVKTPEGQSIIDIEKLYGVDRRTGAHVNGLGDKNRNGYLFAPKHLSPGQSFVYWHVNYDAPANMKYVGQEVLNGLNTFHYQSNYEGVRVDQTNDLGHLPDVGETRGIEVEPLLELWVEPVTGALIKYRDEATAYFYDLNTKERLEPWNHFSNSVAAHSVEANVEGVQITKIRTIILDIYFPLAFFLLAVWLFLREFEIPRLMAEKINLKLLSYLGIGIIFVVGALSLVAWIMGVEEWLKLFPQQRAINPVTAVSFILISAMLALRGRYRGVPSSLIGFTVATIGTIALLHSLELTALEVDLLLFRDAVLSSPVLARMSQFTAISLILIGLIPLVRSFELMRKSRLAEIFSTLVFTFSITAIVGLAIDLRRLLSVPTFSTLSASILVPMAIIGLVCYFAYREEDKYALKLKSWVSINGIILASTLITIGVASALDIVITNEARALFADEVRHTTEAIADRVGIYKSILEGARGLITASNEVTREEWRSYVSNLDIEKSYPGIQGIGYTVFIKPEDLRAHIDKIRKEGFPNYTVRPSEIRDIYTSIIYIEPFDLRNQQALGFDMFQEQTRRIAMEQSRDTGNLRVSGKITLVQEIDSDIQPGFLMYIPVYKNDKPHDTLAQKRANILGYAYAPFRARNFVEGVIGKEGLSNISIRINDGSSESTENLLYDDYAKKIPSDARPKFTEVRTLYLAGRPWVLTFSAAPNFNHTPFALFATPVTVTVGITIGALIVLAFYTLVSSKQRAEEFAELVTRNLRSAKAQDDAILLSVGDGLVATDNEGKIILVNKAFEEMLGWKKEEVIGKKLVDTVPMIDSDQQQVSPQLRLLTKVLWNKMPSTTSNEYRYMRKDGTTFPVTITVSPIIFNDKVVGIVEVFRDITKEKEIDKAKTEFVSLASHQLRTPLSGINWYTEMLLNGDAGKITPDQREFLSEIFVNNQHMIELVNTLLNVSRLEMGKFVINSKPVKLDLLVDSVIEEQQLQIKSKDIKLTKKYPKSVSKINSDPTLLRMAIQNLITNAVKYNNPGGKIFINIEETEDNILLHVKDNGWGIPANQQSQIFGRMFRADNAREGDPEGNGLGLYIVKSIVEKLGGKVWFESRENRGSTFSISLPKRSR